MFKIIRIIGKQAIIQTKNEPFIIALKKEINQFPTMSDNSLYNRTDIQKKKKKKSEKETALCLHSNIVSLLITV